MPNIKLNYFYRDGGNYKNFGSAILSNPDNLSLTEFEKAIRAKLISDTWFYANEWGVPTLFFPEFDPEVEPTWHEFEGLEVIRE